jgi:hypothetical protein
MKSNAFLSGPTVALGLVLTLFGAPARADLVFDWSGSCVTGCPAGQRVSAELDLRLRNSDNGRQFCGYYL